MFQGIELLTNALRINKSLLRLVLDGNHITEVGAESLAACLKVNSSLFILSAKNNKIGNEGCKALASALLKNKTLQRLYIDRNNISDAGAKDILAMLKLNSTLSTVSVKYMNKINDTSLIDRIQELLSENIERFADSFYQALSGDNKVCVGLFHLIRSSFDWIVHRLHGIDLELCL